MIDRNRLDDAVRVELQRLDADYEIGDESCRGGNGVLVFARNRVTERDVAIKFYCAEPGDRQHNEPAMLAKVDSVNVLPILDARTIGDGWAFFLTPRCTHGDLDDAITGGVSAARALDIGLGICAGVSAMHQQRLIHRDLKPANIVMDGDQPLIADFGSVRFLPHGDHAVRASKHSILYRPPESFSSGEYGVGGDVYQIGVVMYQLLGGTLSYDPEAYLNATERAKYSSIDDDFDRQKYGDSILQRRIEAGRLPDFASLPPWARCAERELRRMTAPDPAKRYRTVGEVAMALSALRGRIPNWQVTADGARLVQAGRTVELRGLGGGLYEAFVNIGRGPRRNPGLPKGTLAELVAKVS
jgi:serine/threonine protein kinase